VAELQSVCLVLEPLLLEGLVPGLPEHEFVDELIPEHFVVRPAVVAVRKLVELKHQPEVRCRVIA